MPSNVDKHSVEGEQAVRLCNYVDVYRNERITGELEFMGSTASDAQVARFTLCANDVIITKDSEAPTDIGIPAFVPDALPGVVCGYHLALIRPLTERLHGGFLHWALQSSEVHDYYSTAATGISRYALSVNDIGMTPLQAPSRAEQERIANFLDEQTARIDALIAEKERLLQSLSNYQYSYASKLMTRGLTADAELASTSFPEIGSIPAHWDVKRLKFLGEVRSGVAKGKDLGERDTVTLPYLRVANVQNGFVDLTEVLEIEVPLSEATRYLLQKDDVLMNEGGDNDKLGRGTVWEAQIDPCIHQNHVFAVRLFDTTLADWVSRFTSTDAARAYFFLRSKQSTNLASINQSNVRELPVPMPSAKEREAILLELRRSAKATSDLIEHAQEHVSRLCEYRSSLISAAVTGQLDINCLNEAAA
jgi:type I restriction enzyme S subunit